MNLSYHWLRRYVDIDMEPVALGELLTNLGLEVEGIAKYESIPGGLKGVVVGKVLACTSHPNADKLSLTKVDVGAGDPLPIVCGAPNVKEGQTVLVATVGTTLYDPKGDEWTIRKAKIRGEVSEGMICAEDELGLGDSHEGILVIDDKYEAGTPAADIYPVIEDDIFDISLTPNRSDATNHMGAARDLVAALRVRNGRDVSIRLPERMDIPVSNKHSDIAVEVIDPDACPRYSGLMIRDVKIGESPDWLKHRLESIGIRSINNVVDITNFVLHETGQPLHAFDYHKISGRKVIVDCLPEDTKFTTLDEVERSLRAEDLMICDGDRTPMCIAGVFGGTVAEVSDSTTDIFLESAHFSASMLRMTSMAHLLRTEAAKCFEKGSDPNITVFALQRAAHLMVRYAGARIDGPILDVYPRPIAPVEIAITYEYINRLIGNEIPADKWKAVTSALEMKIIRSDDKGMTVAVPTDKADVTRPADLVEELLRIYGYDHIEIEEQLRNTLVYSEYPDAALLKDLATDTLASNGFHQMMNLSLSQSKYYKGRVEKDSLVGILNTSNVHLDIMRADMLVNGLETAAYNINRQQSDLRLFEFGKIYRKTTDGYAEEDRLLLMMSGRLRSESPFTGDEEVDLYHLKGIVSLLLERFGVDRPGVKEMSGTEYAFGLELFAGDRAVGKLGKIGPELCALFDLEADIFAADLDWSTLCAYAARQDRKFSPISRYPSIRRDLALILPESATYAELREEILLKGGPKLREVNLFDVYRNEEQLGKGNKSYAVSLVFEDREKTMTDKEVDKWHKKVVRALADGFGAKLR